MRVTKQFIISLVLHVVAVIVLVTVTYESRKYFKKPEPYRVQLRAGTQSGSESPAPEQAKEQPKQPEPTPPKVEEKKPVIQEEPKIITRTVNRTTTAPVNKIKPIAPVEDSQPARVKPVEHTTSQPANTNSSSSGVSVATGGDSVWEMMVQNKITANWDQPSRAELGGASPVVEYTIVVEGSGRILSINKTRSSGNAQMDDSAFQAIKRSDPLPKFRDEVRKTVPLTFTVKDEF